MCCNNRMNQLQNRIDACLCSVVNAKQNGKLTLDLMRNEKTALETVLTELKTMRAEIRRLTVQAEHVLTGLDEGLKEEFAWSEQ